MPSLAGANLSWRVGLLRLLQAMDKGIADFNFEVSNMAKAALDWFSGIAGICRKSQPMADLTPKQSKALIALLSEPTVEAAAKKSGVSERAIYNWLAEPGFSEAYRVARREAVSQAIANIQRASSEAVKVLEEVMKNTAEKGTTRVSAAKTIIETAFKAIELEDLTQRIEALEAQVVK